MPIILSRKGGGAGGGGGPPSGPAGGVLSGTYPNPGFAVDMATQAELNAALSLEQVETSLLSGRYTGFPFVASGFGGVVFSVDTLYVFPVYIPYAVTVDRIGVNVQATVATANVRLGIYNDGGAGLPTTLVVDAGLVDAHTSTGFVEATIATALARGRYWLAFCSQTAAANLWAATSDGLSYSTGAVASTNAIGSYAQSAAVAGALPDPFGTVANGVGNPAHTALRIT